MKTKKMLVPIMLIGISFILLIFTFAIPVYTGFVFWTNITIDDLVPGDNWFSAARLEIDCTNLGESVYMSVSNELESGVQIGLNCGSLGMFTIHNENNLQRLRIKLTSHDDRIVYNSNRIPIIECYLGAGDDEYSATYGSGGNLTIHGGSGNDYIRSGYGNDHVYGNDGEDDIGGGNGYDVILGGNQRDVIDGGDGWDTIHGGSGGDVISGGNGVDQIMGDVGNDNIMGGADNDIIRGHDGNDRIEGNDGNDDIEGGAGADSLYGGRGDDRLFGDSGNDLLYGWWGTDRLNGGTGRDIFHDDSLLDGISIYDEMEDYDPDRDTVQE